MEALAIAGGMPTLVSVALRTKFGERSAHLLVWEWVSENRSRKVHEVTPQVGRPCLVLNLGVREHGWMSFRCRVSTMSSVVTQDAGRPTFNYCAHVTSHSVTDDGCAVRLLELSC